MASRLERLVSIDAYIRAGSYPSVEKLCQVFEVQPRTIYQDLRELREMFGLDIHFDRTRNGYYNATPSKQLPPLAMTEEEALLIGLAIEMLAASFGPSFSGALARTLEMLRASEERKLEWLKEVVEFPTTSGCEIKCSILLTVLRCAANRQMALLQLNGNEKSSLKVIPLKIAFGAGHWRVAAQKESGETIEAPLCEIDQVRVIQNV